jgi:pSer/pThr/pTyr-binding forkhead associated (FHA) protein
MTLPTIEPLPPAPSRQEAKPPVQPELENQPTIAVPLKAGFGRLVWLSGPLQGRVTPIPASGARIGRDATTSEIVIDSGSVSKRHAWIGPRNGKVVLEDGGSTNGTYLQASRERITEHALEHGEVVIIANDAARFRYEND